MGCGQVGDLSAQQRALGRGGRSCPVAPLEKGRSKRNPHFGPKYLPHPDLLDSAPPPIPFMLPSCPSLPYSMCSGLSLPGTPSHAQAVSLSIGQWAWVRGSRHDRSRKCSLGITCQPPCEYEGTVGTDGGCRQSSRGRMALEGGP